MIMLITHVSTLLRWDVKWLNFCPPTLLDMVNKFDPSLTQTVFVSGKIQVHFVLKFRINAINEDQVILKSKSKLT